MNNCKHKVLRAEDSPAVENMTPDNHHITDYTFFLVKKQKCL